MFGALTDVAFVGAPYVKGPVRAVVLSFHGLGYSMEKKLPDTEELELAASGALCVFPYYGPWSWMNRQARALVDEIVRRVFQEYRLPSGTPLILRGGSMGGHAALIYARYAKKEPAAVACNCPVADPRCHATERPDLPRTFVYAYGLDGGDMQAAFAENSPIEQAAAMPRVPYFVVHGTADQSVSKAMHSDRLVAAMRACGHDVTYVEAEGMGHCAFLDFAVYRRYQDFVLRFIP